MALPQPHHHLLRHQVHQASFQQSMAEAAAVAAAVCLVGKLALLAAIIPHLQRQFTAPLQAYPLVEVVQAPVLQALGLPLLQWLLAQVQLVALPLRIQPHLCQAHPKSHHFSPAMLL